MFIRLDIVFRIGHNYPIVTNYYPAGGEDGEGTERHQMRVVCERMGRSFVRMGIAAETGIEIPSTEWLWVLT